MSTEIMGYYVFVRSLYLYYVYTRVTDGRSLLCNVYDIGTRPGGRRIDLLYRGYTMLNVFFGGGGTYTKTRIKRRYGKSETTNNNKNNTRKNIGVCYKRIRSFVNDWRKTKITSSSNDLKLAFVR